MNVWKAVGLGFLVLAGGVALAQWYATQSNANDARDRAWEQKRQTDVAAVKQKMAQPITPRIISVGEHEMVVVEVPSATRRGSRIETRRCFVWRDATYRTASLACDKEDSLLTEE